MNPRRDRTPPILDKTEIRRLAEQDRARSLERLGRLASCRNAKALFVSVLLHLSLPHDEGPPSEATHGSIPAKLELLAYHLFPHFESANDSEITPADIRECTNILEGLFSAQWLIPSMAEDQDELSVLMEIRRNAEVVRGSAYPEQITARINEVQGRFEVSLSKKFGIGPTRAQELLWAIIKTQEVHAHQLLEEAAAITESLVQSWRAAKAKPDRKRSPQETELVKSFRNASAAGKLSFIDQLNRLAYVTLPVGPEDLKDLEPPPSCDEWVALSHLIGLTVESRQQISSPSEIRTRSLFVLPDGRALLAEISNSLDNVWVKFDNEAIKDPKLSQRYLKRRASWLEQKVFEALSKIFSTDHIYRNLSYPDPDYTEARTAELDFAIDWGPFLILLEAKSGQFRLEGQMHDPGRLHTDLKKNIEDAFEQARRAARYIDSTPSPLFKEIHGARTLAVRKNEIRKIYLLSVSLHNLGPVATRLAVLRELGLFKGGEYPLSISIDDLDTVARFCEGPDVFLHYIERRLILQKHSIDIFSDELDLFGAYLDTRLQDGRLHLDKGASFMRLTGYSELFDQWILYERGVREDAPEIALNIPAEIRAVLQELRRRQDNAARWVAFAILDMPDSLLGVIAEGLRDLRSAELKPGMFRRGVHAEGDIVVSLVGSLDQPKPLLDERTRWSALVEKYRRKLTKSIGFGLDLSNHSQPFHSAAWVEGPWEEEAELEELVAAAPPGIPARGAKLPGRNDPCFCGSGKKFKKCHLPKLKQEPFSGG